MKRIFFISLFSVFISAIIFAQKIPEFDIELFTRNTILSNNGLAYDYIGDTLVIENKDVFFFKHTPLIVFDGYAKLFTAEDGVLIPKEVGAKGYDCKWIVKQGELYLSNVSFGGIEDGIGYFTIEKDKSGKPVEKTVYLPHDPRQRIEKLTDRKFDENYLLKADWVSGRIGVFTMQQALSPYSDEEKNSRHRDSVFNFQREFQLYFDKGKLWKVQEVKREHISQ